MFISKLGLVNKCDFKYFIPDELLLPVVQAGHLPDSVHRAAGEQSHLLTARSVTAAVHVTHILVFVTGTQPAN